ncbi:hypothetical protein MCOR27_008321 [Pyricularia oryzae]|uniref:Uncharacterized protein n=5 Tax=Pyricularia TaxID=48558 RepID=A0ABQ8N4F0_PYRGI|nr:uncharacterized protein MGG_09489 [Pyricularia oryzae 70-15]ELQ39220.1 hypothetical protein OOU_Y34scaffold00511g10 [Pyricularia oryzae Y34]KAH8847664.1 hypothetical protein MCOR01_001074 [Pyricularia oryzae]KAI6290979.1 hypothetical protein MCOR33_010924 [Pyricularia grisea]EHA52448.1 hypothetical protein MGG_09489 [Pyricularia oryzae 70-15]KAH9430407.1 hypothetical protein MCOR02_010111 [Pyricularia oryzae]
MPKQHVIFGRPVPQIPPRRIALLLACLGIFAVGSLLFTLPSTIETGPNLSKFTDLRPSIPKKITGAVSSWKNSLNPFKPPSHPPHRQSNDTLGESSWYSDWKWLSSPFSSTVTLDENRSILPPMKIRTPIYCYYDTVLAEKKDKARRDAESALLLSWRRAWWAQGFKPIILSIAEAINNPKYAEVQGLKLEPELKTDLMKWLAWENMGDGVLSHYLVFPMAAREDHLLAYLRRGEYPALTRWKGMDDGLFVGPQSEVAAAIKQAIANPRLEGLKDFITAVSNTASKDQKDKDVFTIDDPPKSIAFYDEKGISTTYGKIGEVTEANHAEWLLKLDALINAHLQTAWQNVFHDGIAVVKPYPEHTTAMVDPAVKLATRLSTCLDSPMPASCPPNWPKCRPCKPGSVKTTTPSKYANTTALYSIGTVPHPYTLQTMISRKPRLDVSWLVRHSKRDAWLDATMQGLVDKKVSGGARVIRFKEAVAGDYAAARSLWIPAEREVPNDLAWRFGFTLPPAAGDDDEKDKPAPKPKPEPKKETEKGDKKQARDMIPDETLDNERLVEEELNRDLNAGTEGTPAAQMREDKLLKQAKEIRFSKDPSDVKVREAAEAWNLADTEAWRFARAFLARSRMERMKWEEEERHYAGGAGAEKVRQDGKGIGRWLERN